MTASNKCLRFLRQTGLRCRPTLLRSGTINSCAASSRWMSSSPTRASRHRSFSTFPIEDDDDDYYPYDPNHPALHGSLTPAVPVARIRNFSPGPTSLPEAVEAEIMRSCFSSPPNGDREERFRRLPTISLSHRSPEFSEILHKALESTRAVMEIPEEYEVLFVHAGGHGQFAAIPLNLCPTGTETAHYVINGTWSERAANEASKYCRPVAIHGPTDPNGTYIGYPSLEGVDPSSKYIYLCSNETVSGLELHRLPTGSKVPLVVDASSDVSSKPIDWRGANVGLYFGCASKNIGHPGVTMVVVRKDLLNEANVDICPGVLHYKTNVEANMVWNTTATFNVDVLRIVMDWIQSEGGIHAMEEFSIRKAQKFYDVIYGSNGFYSTTFPEENGFRSRMNIPFAVGGGDDFLTDRFVIEASERGLVGFRTKTPFGVGSLRASFYHGVSDEDVDHLVAFMADFADLHACDYVWR